MKKDSDGSSPHLRGTLGVRAAYTFPLLGLLTMSVLVITWLISARLSKWTTLRLLDGTDKTGPYPTLAYIACGLAVITTMIAAVAYKALHGIAIYAVIALMLLLIACTVTVVIFLSMTAKQTTKKTLNQTKFEQWQTYVRVAAWITTGVFVGFVVVLFSKYMVAEKTARKEVGAEEGVRPRGGESERPLGGEIGHTDSKFSKQLDELQQAQRESSARTRQLEEMNRHLISQSTERAVQDAQRAADLAQQTGIKRQAAEVDTTLLREEERRRQVGETAASIRLSLARAEEDRKRHALQGKYALEQGYLAGVARVDEDVALSQAARADYSVGAGAGAVAGAGMITADHEQQVLLDNTGAYAGQHVPHLGL